MNRSVYLRALEMSDLDRIHKWHNDEELSEMLGGSFHFVSRHATQTWLERKTDFSSYSLPELRLAICVRGSDQHVGNVYLLDINWIVRHAQLQIFIGDRDERSKGYGQPALRQLLSYAFGDMGLKRIYLSVLPDNHVAIHIYEKVGFKVEGRFKNHLFKKGRWRDMIVMGICEDDYKLDADIDDKMDI